MQARQTNRSWKKFIFAAFVENPTNKNERICWQSSTKTRTGSRQWKTFSGPCLTRESSFLTIRFALDVGSASSLSCCQKMTGWKPIPRGLVLIHITNSTSHSIPNHESHPYSPLFNRVVIFSGGPLFILPDCPRCHRKNHVRRSHQSDLSSSMRDVP